MVDKLLDRESLFLRLNKAQWDEILQDFNFFANYGSSIIKYVKNLSNNLSNENIKIGVSREIILLK